MTVSDMYRIVYAPMLGTMGEVERAVMIAELRVEGVVKCVIGGHTALLVPVPVELVGGGLSYDHAEVVAMITGEDDDEGQGRPATGGELTSAVRAMWPRQVDLLRGVHKAMVKGGHNE
jgi:hypothetical protein